MSYRDDQRSEDIDLVACTVRVTRQLNKLGVVPVFGPRSRALAAAGCADLPALV